MGKACVGVVELFFDLLEVLGHWMVFSFSLYEGLLNLGEHAAFAKKYAGHIGELHFTPLERLILPMYFYKLKETAVSVVKKENMPANEASELFKLIDRAILWIYLSIGGWFVWLCALFNLVKNYTDFEGILFYLAMAALGTLLSMLNVKIRIRKRRERLLRVAVGADAADEEDFTLP